MAERHLVCPQSIEAIAGAISAVCEAVDISIQGNVSRFPEDTVWEVKPTIPFTSSLETLEAVSASIDATTAPRIKQNSTTDQPSQIPLPPSPTLAPLQFHEGTLRSFAAIRPPGHHCSDEKPSGFCFVNNVMIGVAHGMLTQSSRRSNTLVN